MEHDWFATSPLELARYLEAMAERLVTDAAAIRKTTAEAPPPATVPENRNLLDIMDLAEVLSVSRSAIYQMRNEGNGPPFLRIGNRVRYRWQDVNTWLQQQIEPNRR